MSQDPAPYGPDVAHQRLTIPAIDLSWSPWFSWNELIIDARGGGVRIPNHQPGVYEVRLADSDERLTIGKAADLRMRIRQGLLKGKVPHSSGIHIRANEDPTQLLVRWAVTDHPAAAEEELHRLYRATHGCLPRYTQRT